MLQCVKELDYLCNCKSEISNVFNVLEGHCLEPMKIVHHHPNCRFDWLISENQSVNPSRKAMSILSEKYKRKSFVFPRQYRNCFSFKGLTLLCSEINQSKWPFAW